MLEESCHLAVLGGRVPFKVAQASVSMDIVLASPAFQLSSLQQWREE